MYQVIRSLVSFRAFRPMPIPPQLGASTSKWVLRTADDLASFDTELLVVQQKFDKIWTSANYLLHSVKELGKQLKVELDLYYFELKLEERKVPLTLLDEYRTRIQDGRTAFAERLKVAALIMDSRCRRQGCGKQHRPGLKSGNGLKARRGRQAFCKADSGLKNRVSKEVYNRLFSDPTLQVAVV